MMFISIHTQKLTAYSKSPFLETKDTDKSSLQLSKGEEEEILDQSMYLFISSSNKELINVKYC